MPCKKKSISPLYFQIYTPLFTDNFFSFCACAQMFTEGLCEKKNLNIPTSADDETHYNKLLRKQKNL